MRKFLEALQRNYLWLLAVLVIQIPLSFWGARELITLGAIRYSKSTVLKGRVFEWYGGQQYASFQDVKIEVVSTISGEAVAGAEGKREWQSGSKGEYEIKISADGPVSILFTKGDDFIPELQRIPAKAGTVQRIDIAFLSYNQAKKLAKDTNTLGPAFVLHLNAMSNILQTLPKDNAARQHIPRLDKLAKAIKPTPIDDSADRAAAKFVLDIGGKMKIRINDEVKEVSAIAELPPQPIQLVSVNLEGNKKINDDWLKNLRFCKNLKHLQLSDTAVSDIGLDNFKIIDDLNYLNLTVQRVFYVTRLCRCFL
ncbi:hypothetical protein [Fimbriiglobus ruber]|uniref:hypothetical protein n=1 Tax=Fimbriiglobus ruber TaxID=1908690 RepID=UPI000B4AC347|nr:hypothetical protein [Fimbriiglobus ruber]